MPSIFDYWATLASPVNKVEAGSEQQEGVVSPLLPELELDMPDEQIIRLTQGWESLWQLEQGRVESRRKANEDYWKGNTAILTKWWGDDRPLADNLIFEAVETFAPIATKKNPEPVVAGGESEEGKVLAEKVRKMLIDLTDRLHLKLKIKRGTHNWLLYLLGAWKVTWSEADNEMDVLTIRPQKLILDPKAYIDEGGEYTGDFIGEYRDDTAENLVLRFPDKKKDIEDLVQGKMGTKVRYVEWWTRKYLFFTLKKTVLRKSKNPHWNYEEETKSVDEMGVEQVETTPGSNHFSQMKMPYVFLSVFNDGTAPYDPTSLVEQVQRLQDIVNKRILQLDRNADNTNSGMRISGDHFTQSEAGTVVRAMQRGNAAWVPRGDVNKALSRDVAPPLPSFIYESLQDARQELRGIFGTSALSGQGIASTETVRGKILARTADDSRIGGGVTECVEQVYDQLYNWMVQMMYVYYSEQHAASILGEVGGMEYVTLRNDEMNQRLTISVKEGSLIPEDPLTKRNEAIDLWNAGAIDPITLFKRLGDANPLKSAQDLFTWQTNPGALFGAPAAMPGATPSAATGGERATGTPVANPVDQAAQGAIGAADLANVPIQ